MATIQDEEKEKWGRMGLKQSPFGVPLSNLKEKPTIKMVMESIGLIHVRLYGYTHTSPNSSRDAYYSQDWKMLDQAFTKMYEVLKIGKPIIKGYSRINFLNSIEHGKKRKPDPNEFTVNGEALSGQDARETDNWETAKVWVLGFANALRQIPFPNPEPNFDNEGVKKAFEEMLQALDMMWISLYWQ